MSVDLIYECESKHKHNIGINWKYSYFKITSQKKQKIFLKNIKSKERVNSSLLRHQTLRILGVNSFVKKKPYEIMKVSKSFPWLLQHYFLVIVYRKSHRITEL